MFDLGTYCTFTHTYIHSYLHTYIHRVTILSLVVGPYFRKAYKRNVTLKLFDSSKAAKQKKRKVYNSLSIHIYTYIHTYIYTYIHLCMLIFIYFKKDIYAYI